MQLVYAREPLPDHVAATIFLAGPTPRSRDVPSWRPGALDYLAALGFAGTVFIPEDRSDAPLELHDFFLFHMIRNGFTPRKIAFLADRAFVGTYARRTILRWLGEFYRRFFGAQFKRNAAPDGPKVGSVSLSPRGNWRMPADASGDLWIAEVDDLQAKAT